MNQEKIGLFIKNIRKKNNLTQEEFANKLGVTYQAVSKWENGKNIPDIGILKMISKEFNIDLNDLLDGEIKAKKKNKHNYIYLVIIGILIILLISLYFILKKNNDYEFKVLTSTCNNFDISGTIAYNDNKSSIYINNINYCGDDSTKLYSKIECTLYETNGNIERKISDYEYSKNKITLEDFLHKVVFKIDNYSRSCKEFTDNTLYLEINATDDLSKITTYKIPIELSKECSK
jgi:transcriptional regulator with XRE-family HTH domain